LEETGNYSEYTKVFGNKVWSSMRIIRNYVTSYEVIEYEIKPDRFILEEYKWTERKIYFSTDVLGRLDVRKV